MKIQVVDDDTVSRMVLAHILHGLGPLQVVEAEDGERAWDQLEQGLRPAICFCDVRMPRLSGLDLLQRMKATAGLAGIPFVLVSSSAEPDTVRHAIKLGAAAFMAKPFAVAEVRTQLEKNVRNWEKVPENPVATLRRLNIAADRLIAYLAAFEVQLHSARAEMTDSAGPGPKQADLARIMRLHAACVTLGLWDAAALFDSITGQSPSDVDGPSAGSSLPLETGSYALSAILDQAVKLVRQQSKLVEGFLMQNGR